MDSIDIKLQFDDALTEAMSPTEQRKYKKEGFSFRYALGDDVKLAKKQYAWHAMLRTAPRTRKEFGRERHWTCSPTLDAVGRQPDKARGYGK